MSSAFCAFVATLKLTSGTSENEPLAQVPSTNMAFTAGRSDGGAVWDQFQVKYD